MTMQAAASSHREASKPLRVGLWAAQTAVAALFCSAGFMKLTTPIRELSAMMPWTGEFPEAFVRTIGAIDLAGGVGILLPALIRIQPRLTILAALGCALLQVCAMVFHGFRGEFAAWSMNIPLLALSLFVVWGRSTRAPIAGRG